MKYAVRVCLFLFGLLCVVLAEDFPQDGYFCHECAYLESDPQSSRHCKYSPTAKEVTFIRKNTIYYDQKKDRYVDSDKKRVYGCVKIVGKFHGLEVVKRYGVLADSQYGVGNVCWDGPPFEKEPEPRNDIKYERSCFCNDHELCNGGRSNVDSSYGLILGILGLLVLFWLWFWAI